MLGTWPSRVRGWAAARACILSAQSRGALGAWRALSVPLSSVTGRRRRHPQEHTLRGCGSRSGPLAAGLVGFYKVPTWNPEFHLCGGFYALGG